MTELGFDDWLSGLNLEFWGASRHKVQPSQFFERMRSGEKVTLLDVRAKDESRLISFPFATHIPIETLPAEWPSIPKDGLVAIHCSSGVRSAIAYAYLQLKGLENVRVLAGGYDELIVELKAGKAVKLLKSLDV